MVVAGWLYGLRAPENDNLERNLNQLRELREPPKVVFLGDSHFAGNILVQELPKGYLNLSFPGESPLAMLVKLQFLLDNRLLPRVVVLEADPQLVGRKLTTAGLWRFGEMVCADSLFALTRSDIFANFFAKAAWQIPALDPQNRQIMLGALASKFRKVFPREKVPTIDNVCVVMADDNRHKWSNFTREEKGEIASSTLRLQFENKLKPDSNVQNILRKIVGLCSRHGIKVVLLRSPVTAEYYKGVERMTLGNFEEYYPNLPESRIINARKLYLEKPELFGDSDHLNTNGARLYTHWLLGQLELEQH
jgi:hypothetical protein